MLPQPLLATVLESAPDAIIIADADGRILFSNRQLSMLFGYEAAEIQSLNVEALIPERFRDKHTTHRRHYAENVRVRAMGAGLELFGRRKDGSEFPVEISLSPVRDGTRTLVAAAIRDTTERKKIQAELTDAREAADQANRAKSRFLAMASHDLRQPLQTITLLNGTLRRIVHDSSAQEILQYELQALEAMTRLLNGLLDISRLESGAIEPAIAEFDIVGLVDELRHEFLALAENRGLEFRCRVTPAQVRSDAGLLGQILRNLLANAIKFTPKGWVALRTQATGTQLRIEVADSGIGIAPEDLALIYDEFFQVGTTHGSADRGYGLGLSIVRRLVSLLNLKLEVTSTVGQGSVFAVEVPLGTSVGPSIAGGRAGPGSRPRRTHAPRVLLVEDDPGVRDATRMLLNVEGYQVTTAASLAEAMEKTRSTPDLDLLITDYHLGKSDTGTEVIAGVRQSYGRNIGAILVTGDTSRLAQEIGADQALRVVHKPIDADELLLQIEALLPD